MKKLFALLLSAAMTLSLAACGGTTAGTDTSAAASADTAATAAASESAAATAAAASGERTQLIVGFDAEFPPYGYKADDGSYVGFDLDLAQEVCDRNGWELVKQPIDWDSKDMELSAGTIDCIWNGFTITGRENDYTWTDPYIDNSQVIVVSSDSGITDFNGLSGKVVAVQADSSALAALTDTEDNDDNLALAATFSQLQQVPDYNSAFLNLDSGAVDAIAMDIGVAQYEIKNRGDKYVILDQTLSTEQYAVGFLKGNTELRDQVQKTLYEMQADGATDKILSKWDSEEWGSWDLADSFCLGDYKTVTENDVTTVEAVADSSAASADASASPAA